MDITLDNIVSITKSKFKSSSLHRVSWTPTLWCNYNCDYCVQKNARRKDDVTTRFPKIEHLLEEAKKLNNVIEQLEDDRIELHLIGGEVTFIDWPLIFSTALTSTKIKRVRVVTNLSPSLEKLLAFKEALSTRDINLMLIASLHESQIKNLDEFFDKAAALDTRITMVVNKANFDKITKIKDELQKRHIKFVINFDRTEPELLDMPEIMSLINNSYEDEELGNWGTNYDVMLKDGSKHVLNIVQVRTLFTKPFSHDNFLCYSDLRLTQTGKFRYGTCRIPPDWDTVDQTNITNAIGPLKCTLSSGCHFCNIIKLVRQDLNKE